MTPSRTGSRASSARGSACVGRELGGRSDARRSHDRDAIRAREFPDGWLFFRHNVEVERRAHVAPLLRLLWGNGIPAVAACDYEEELPEGGGSKSRNVPWPAELPPFDCTVRAKDRTRTRWQLRDWLERELGHPVDVRPAGKRDHRYLIECPEELAGRLLRVLHDDGIRAELRQR